MCSAGGLEVGGGAVWPERVPVDLLEPSDVDGVRVYGASRA